MFTGHTERAIGLLSTNMETLDIVNPTFMGAQDGWFFVADGALPPGSLVRVQLADGTAFRLHPASSTVGVLMPAWNARKESIEPFD